MFSFVPVVNRLERLFKLVQHFGWRGPLHMLAIILHGSDVAEALGDLADVGLHLVAAVVPEDREGSPRPLVAEPSQGAPPDLRATERTEDGVRRKEGNASLFLSIPTHSSHQL